MINLVSRGNILGCGIHRFLTLANMLATFQSAFLCPQFLEFYHNQHNSFTMLFRSLCWFDDSVAHSLSPSEIVMVFACFCNVSSPSLFCHVLSYPNFSAFHGCPASVLQQLFDLLQNSHAALSSQRSKHQPHLRENRCIMGPLNWSKVGPITMIRL